METPTEFTKNIFFGSLTNFNFNNYEFGNLIKVLIEKEIYVAIDRSELKQKHNYKTSFSGFTKDFYHNDNYYKLNPQIAIGIFQFYLMQNRLFELKSNAYFSNSVFTSIDKIDNDFLILKVLKKEISKLVKKRIHSVFELDDLITLFDKETQTKDGFIDIFYQYLSSEEIENFLTLKSLVETGYLLSKWQKYILQNIQIEVYNKYVFEYEQRTVNESKLKAENNPLKGIIFKNSGEEIFSFIVEKYPKTKNTAFFSYLYFFLKDDLKILQVIGTDSKDYRQFITGVYNIPFSRIQNTNSQNQYKKNEVFQLFKNYITEYYSLKTEYNLSKNE